jgi:phage terminase large subunit-like protein
VRTKLIENHELYWHIRPASSIVAVDRSSGFLVDEMHDAGYSLLHVPAQRHALAPVIDDLQGLIQQRKVVHLGDPAVRWMMANTYGIHYADGGIMPAKAHNLSLNCNGAGWALIMANAVRLAHLRGEIA